MKTYLYLFTILSTLFIIHSDTSLTKFEYKPLAVLPRQKAPFWSGIAVEGEKFVKKNSAEYLGNYYVLLFYPFDFTYVCPTELIAFSESIDKFDQINTKVIGVSTDSHFTHLAWIRTPRNQGGVGRLNFPLLADISKNISRNFQVLVEDETDELFGAALRGLFIIDDKGIIRSFTINDAPVGRSVDETIRLIQAFQHADMYGEVCPANWKPGSDTIQPDQDAKKEYFEKAYKDL
jgi:alkyl hydroperoxide reductase subunit AhpC